MRRSIHEAAGVAQAVFTSASAGVENPSSEILFETVRQFEGIEFDVPSLEDADGFLFQYGNANWLPEPTFILGVTRQLATDASGVDIEEYLQVQFEYRYRTDSDLDKLGSHSSWWFRGGDIPFSEWFADVTGHPVWETVSSKSPVAFEISQDTV
ncbi:hypothetical protein [Streptomyces sp. NPDC002845]